MSLQIIQLLFRSRPTAEQDLSGTYYYENNAADIVTMLNKALITAWDDLLASVFLTSPAEVSAALRKTYPPFFEFDTDKCRLVLNIDQSFVDGVTPHGKFDGLLHFNASSFRSLLKRPSLRQGLQGWRFELSVHTRSDEHKVAQGRKRGKHVCCIELSRSCLAWPFGTL